MSANRDTFERLYREHVEQVEALVSRMMPSSADQEDLVQETFLQALRGLPHFQERCSFSTWIHRIAHNVCLQERRRLARRRERTGLHLAGACDLAVSGGVWDPDTEAERRDFTRSLGVAICQLPENQRQAVVLGPILGRRQREVASRLHVSVEILKARLCRARVSLRRTLAA